MQARHFTISSSSEKKLVFLAVILYSLAIFLPWMTESYVYAFIAKNFRWNIRVSSFTFWSFMTIYDGKELFFEKFWLQKPLTSRLGYDPLWNGLYNGWSLVFAFQIITLTYSLMCLLNWRAEKLKERHLEWLLILPLTTILLALYQGFIQLTMTYRDIAPFNSVELSIGFWLAISSFIILLATVLTAPQQSPLKKIPHSLKKLFKRMWPAIIVLSIASFAVVEELEFQTGITKAMFSFLKTGIDP